MACDGGKPLSAFGRHDLPKRIVHRGHRINRPNPPSLAQALECIDVHGHAVTGYRGDLQPQRLRQRLEAEVGQGIGSDHVSRHQEGCASSGQRLLRAVGNQHLVRRDLQTPALEVLRYDGSLMSPTSMRM